MFGEPGGATEFEVAELVASGGFTKPIVAHVAGKFTEGLPHGVKFGHAGAIIQSESSAPSFKAARLRESGVAVAERIADIPALVRRSLG